MSQIFDEVTGWPLASMPERDRSQLPLWPELESELEQALAAEVEAPFGDTDLVSLPGSKPALSAAVSEIMDPALPLLRQIQEMPIENPVQAVSNVAALARVLEPGEHRLDARAGVLPDADAELGQRLRAARERAEIGRDEVARRTRIAPAFIQAIEEGRFERLGANVFARGYLRSYARAVDLPDAVVGVWEGRVHRVLEDAPAPSLAATSPRRSSRQVASPIVYTLLTVLIAVPAYYGVRQAQQSPLLYSSAPKARVESFETSVAPATGQASDTDATVALPAEIASEELRTTSNAVPKADAWRQPVMASLTPMLGNANDPGPAPVPLDLRHVQVRLTAPSWIEIVASDGRVIERSLLPKGSMREYSVPRSARVRIGDVDAVELRADGKVIDLTPHTQANVATLTLDEAG